MLISEKLALSLITYVVEKHTSTYLLRSTLIFTYAHTELLEILKKKTMAVDGNSLSQKFLALKRKKKVVLKLANKFL